jgi:hypothetical protein
LLTTESVTLGDLIFTYPAMLLRYIESDAAMCPWFLCMCICQPWSEYNVIFRGAADPRTTLCCLMKTVLLLAPFSRSHIIYATRKLHLYSLSSFAFRYSIWLWPLFDWPFQNAVMLAVRVLCL